MSKSSKHSDPTKKKCKFFRKKSDSESSVDKTDETDAVDKDYRKIKLPRQSESLSYSRVPQIRSTTSNLDVIEEKSTEGKKSQVLRFLSSSKILPRFSASNAPSQSTEFPRKGILKIEKYPSSHVPSRHSLGQSSLDVNQSSTESSVILEEESQVILPLNSSKSTFEERKSLIDIDPNDSELIDATYLRDLSRVKEALKRGANINAVKNKETPLLIATEYDDLRLVSFFLKIENLDLNYRDCHGRTALMIALKNGFDKIAETLIFHGANVNVKDNIGRTPLHMALFHSKVDLARLLLIHGADYEAADCFGERPMYTCAVKRPNVQCLNLLLEAGAAPDYYHITGISLLSRAIFDSTSYEIIETLIKSGADVNYSDFYSGKTPLHVAAAVNNLRIVKLLLEYGADPNIETKYGYTPYDQAIFHGSLEVAQYLAQMTEDAKWGLLTDLKKNKSKPLLK